MSASSQASGGDMNDSPASSSLCLIAIAAAGPRNAKTSSANAIPAASDVVDHAQVVVRRALPEPGAADVQPQLVQPALEAGVGGHVAWRNADAHAEHRLAAQAFDPFDAAHQVDEHDDGEGEADDRGIDEMPMIRIVNGIQSHTAAIAAPVSSDAEGAGRCVARRRRPPRRCAACRRRLVERGWR